MRLPTKEEIIQKLKPLGIETAKLATDPATLEKAVLRTYKLIPIPWRWFVGRKRIEKLLKAAATASASKLGNSTHSSAATNQSNT